jgi:hypothetical protein
MKRIGIIADVAMYHKIQHASLKLWPFTLFTGFPEENSKGLSRNPSLGMAPAY